MDWRFTIIGAIMIGIGITISLIYMDISNTGPLEMFTSTRMIAQLGGVLAGLGLLIVVVSFGLQRRRFKI